MPDGAHARGDCQRRGHLRAAVVCDVVVGAQCDEVKPARGKTRNGYGQCAVFVQRAFYFARRLQCYVQRRGVCRAREQHAGDQSAGAGINITAAANVRAAG